MAIYRWSCGLLGAVLLLNVAQAEANLTSDFSSILSFGVNDTFSGSFSYDMDCPRMDDQASWEDWYLHWGYSTPLFDWQIGGTRFQQRPGQRTNVVIDNIPAAFDQFLEFAQNYVDPNVTLPEDFALPSGWNVSTSGPAGYSTVCLELMDWSASAFQDTSLPDSLMLSDFGSSTICYYLNNGPGETVTLETSKGMVTAERLDIVGQIDSLTLSTPSSSMRNYSFTGYIADIRATEPSGGGGGGGSSVPEPASLALLALAVGGVGATLRRRRSQPHGHRADRGPR